MYGEILTRLSSGVRTPDQKKIFESMKSANVPLSSCEKEFLLQGIRSKKVKTEICI